MDKIFSRYEIYMDGKRYTVGNGWHVYDNRKEAVKNFNLLKELWPGNKWDIMIVYEYPPEKVTWGL